MKAACNAAAVLLSFACGCTSLSECPQLGISRNDLAAMFLPFNRVHFSDDNYWVIPSDEWLWDAWSEFDDIQARAGAGCDLPKYHCHSATIGLLWTTQAKYARERHSDACGSPAVGEVWYRRSEDGVRHAVVSAVVGGDLEFFDPVKFSRLFLTPKELASIEFVRF